MGGGGVGEAGVDLALDEDVGGHEVLAGEGVAGDQGTVSGERFLSRISIIPPAYTAHHKLFLKTVLFA